MICSYCLPTHRRGAHSKYFHDPFLFCNLNFSQNRTSVSSWALNWISIARTLQLKDIEGSIIGFEKNHNWTYRALKFDT